MGKAFNQITLGVIVLIFGIFLSSCGVPAEKGIIDIEMDIMATDSYFSDYNLSIDNSDITKRQTNKKDKTDYIWLDLTAGNSEFTYSASYEMMYVLYNDGWLLEYCEIVSSDVAPNWYPTENDAADIIKSDYGEYSLASSSQNGRRATYTYLCSETYYYLVTNYSVDVIFTFSPEKGWTYTMNETEIGGSLDIKGEWLYEDDERYFYVNIIDVPSELNGALAFDATLSYDLRNIHTSSIETTTKNSNGPVEMLVRSHNSERYDWYIDLNPYSVYGSISIYVGRTHHLTNSSGYGIACDGYFLSKLE